MLRCLHLKQGFQSTTTLTRTRHHLIHPINHSYVCYRSQKGVEDENLQLLHIWIA